LQNMATTGDRHASLRLSGGEATLVVRARVRDCPYVESEAAQFLSTSPFATLAVIEVSQSVLRTPTATAFAAGQIVVADRGARGFFALDLSTLNLQAIPVYGDILAVPLAVDGGMAVGPGGYLYFADETNHGIRFAFPSPRYVFTLAGKLGEAGFSDGNAVTARFRSPSAIAVDAESALYVTDSGNHSIRRIQYDPETFDFMTTTVTDAFVKPAGIAIDAAGNIIVADEGDHTIRRVAAGGDVTTIGGRPGVAGHVDGMTSLFNEPRGVAVDERGNIYVAEAGNRDIRKISPNGRVTTVAGGFFMRPGFITVAPDGSLWIPDEEAGKIFRAVQPSTGERRRAVRR
jgi:sugar lactone lactonase YvrE